MGAPLFARHYRLDVDAYAVLVCLGPESPELLPPESLRHEHARDGAPSDAPYVLELPCVP